VAKQNNNLVGTVSAVPQGEALYIRSMALLPTVRGQGIGRLLLQAIEEFARARDCQRLFLSTTPFLLRAIRLYEHFGFRRSNEGAKDLFGTPLFTMVKTLEPSGETKSKLLMSKETAEHYVWGMGCDGWHLVKTAELSVIYERMPTGTSEARHFHTRARQFFFVLTGTATLEIAGVRQVLRAHEGLEVPPKVPHQMFNESDQPIEFLVVSHPASHGDRLLVANDTG
jgi:mannose-6-phosphate isomerase-like protein (cupin superfamily)